MSLDFDFRDKVNYFLDMSRFCRVPRFEYAGGFREPGDVLPQVDRVVLTNRPDILRPDMRRPCGSVQDWFPGSDEHFPGIGADLDETDMFVRRVNFSNIFNTTEKALEYFDGLEALPDGPETANLRRDVCNVILSRWQASTYTPGGSSAGMAIENLMADNPDTQRDLLNYVKSGAAAYEAFYMGSDLTGPQQDFRDAAARLAGDYMSMYDRDFAGMDFRVARGAADIRNLVAGNALRRERTEPGLCLSDFGFNGLDFMGPGAGDTVLGPDVPGASEFVDAYLSRGKPACSRDCSDLDAAASGIQSDGHEQPECGF